MFTMTPEEYIDKLNPAIIYAYSAYWKTLKPDNDDDIFRRFIFAITSIHTTWQNNVRAYNLLKNLDWIGNENQINDYLHQSKIGLFKNRKKSLVNLSNLYITDRNSLLKDEEESWDNYRNKIISKIFMLGLAKSSFAISMCYPLESESICLDTHMLKFFNYSNSNIRKKDYKDMEKQWVTACKKREYPPALCREIYWDRVQKHSDSKYWTYCLEK